MDMICKFYTVKWFQVLLCITNNYISILLNGFRYWSQTLAILFSHS